MPQHRLLVADVYEVGVGLNLFLSIEGVDRPAHDPAIDARFFMQLAEHTLFRDLAIFEGAARETPVGLPPLLVLRHENPSVTADKGLHSGSNAMLEVFASHVRRIPCGRTIRKGDRARMKIECLIEAIEAARQNWDYAINLVPVDKREWKASPDAWSLKDIIAHVAWHDNQMIELAETKDLIGSPWWDLSTDERNDKIYEQYKDMPIAEVLAFAEDAYPRMMAALRTLSDEDVNDPTRFTDMPEDWIPWRMLANNTYEHYIRHIGQIRAFGRAADAA